MFTNIGTMTLQSHIETIPLLPALLFLHTRAMNTIRKCKVLNKQNKSTLYQCDALRVLLLKGSPLERASLYGKLIKDKVLQRAPLHFFSTLVDMKSEKLSTLLSWSMGTVHAYFAKQQYKKMPSDWPHSRQ